ncbi:PLC-like phosphodiesterase [Catenaria anguillulae PL171]|uniref:PLC-like phosphodiesterase n=1 Tax=Catenaria anguillulae PL171 TaxID=765915 RepID=A0A1Y2HFQ7_9FUNG|nr:PLC-like phosphodiesterase [Catenaria anguillulae PL171]
MNRLTITTLALVAIATLLTQAKAQAQACNGHASLCSKPITQVTFAGTHNSFASAGGLGATQFTNISTQLDQGIRLINIDIHKFNSSSGTPELRLCHGSCALGDNGPAISAFRTIRDFLTSPAGSREVVAVIVENAAKASYADFANLLSTSGLTPLAYSQPPGTPSAWPTLGDMISRNKRLLLFASDLPAPPAGQPLPLVMPHFAYISETPFQLRQEADWTCALDRPRGQPRELVLVNHWLYKSVFGFDSPDAENAKTVNVASELRTHVSRCESVRKQKINFVLVDFYEHGDILQVVAGLNNVPYTPKPKPPIPTSASGSGGITFGVATPTPTPPAAGGSADAAARSGTDASSASSAPRSLPTMGTIAFILLMVGFGILLPTL